MGRSFGQVIGRPSYIHTLLLILSLFLAKSFIGTTITLFCQLLPNNHSVLINAQPLAQADHWLPWTASRHSNTASRHSSRSSKLRTHILFWFSYLFLLNYSVYTCRICVCVQKGQSDFLELELQAVVSHLTWVVENELWSSTRAACESSRPEL